jgi:hypothetical protein
MLDCRSWNVRPIVNLSNFPLKRTKVQRVHWLRARAQKARWQEEVTLLGYEMQWTVRYYMHMSERWQLGIMAPNAEVPSAEGQAGTSGGTWPTGSESGLPPVTGTSLPQSEVVIALGASAYAHCQCAAWDAVATLADRTFKSTNSHYVSPLS